MTETILLSASQRQRFNECPRSWAFEKIDGKETPEKDSAKLGTRVHEILEAWLLTGKAPNVHETMSLTIARSGEPKLYFPGQIAQAGLYLLPPPGTVIVEGHFTFNTDAAPWQGMRDGVTVVPAHAVKTFNGIIKTIDFGQARRPDVMPPRRPTTEHDGDVIVLLDHKSTGSFDWQKSADDLRTDIQANLYAADLYRRWGAPIIAQWIYYRTTGRPEARVTYLPFDPVSVAQQIVRIDAGARRMMALRMLPVVAAEVPTNTSACDNYGGCAHRSYCGLTVIDLMETPNMTQVEASLDDLINTKLADRAPPPPLPPAMQPPAPPPLPAHLAAPPPPPAPRAWQPGDPMNAVQVAMYSAGAQPNIVALAADNPPSPAVAATYVTPPAPPAAVTAPAFHTNGAAPGTIPASPGFAHVGGNAFARVPEVERTHINSPEGPRYPAATPQEAAAQVQQATAAVTAEIAAQRPATTPGPLAALNRAQLKDLAVKLGLTDDKTKMRESGLREVLEKTLTMAQQAEAVARYASEPKLPDDINQRMIHTDRDTIAMALFPAALQRAALTDSTEAVVARAYAYADAFIAVRG